MASSLIRADVATIDRLDAAVTSVAESLRATMPDAEVDDRRVHAVRLLAHPGATPVTELADLLPDVELFVHVYGGTSSESGGLRREEEVGLDGVVADRVARLEGHGPVTETWIRQVLGPNARFTIRPVLDLADQAPVDAYEIPDRHRRAVHLITPADTFPFASCLSRTQQVDHTVPYDQGGISGVGNYGPMTTRHHRIKTHGRWQVQQPFPGIYLWRDPYGACYLVDHTGTRRIHHDRGDPRPGSRVESGLMRLVLDYTA